MGRRGGRGDPREKLRVYRGRTGACEAMAAAAAAVTVLDVPFVGCSCVYCFLMDFNSLSFS